jgi:hypothetical protein
LSFLIVSFRAKRDQIFLGIVGGMSELPVLQKAYDLVRWYTPILNRLPKNYKFNLGDRLTTNLYNLLDGLIQAKYQREEKFILLRRLNTQLEVMRFQTRLLHDLELIPTARYEDASGSINAIGINLGGWLKQQKARL